eukprot:7295765-Pyramimonas_sp.AAC.2
MRSAYHNLQSCQAHGNLRTRIDYLRANKGPVFYRLVFPLGIVHVTRCLQTLYRSGALSSRPPVVGSEVATKGAQMLNTAATKGS